MSSFAGPVTALSSSAVFGTSDFLGGVLSRRHRPIVVVAWSHATALVILSVICAVAGLPGTWAWLPWSVLAGVTGALGLVAFYTALSTGTIGVVSPIAALGVVIPVAMALVDGERPSWVQGLGIVIALAGALLASGPELRHEERHRARAVLWAVLAAVGFGLAMWAMIKGAQTSSLGTMTGMRATSTTGFVALALVKRSVGGVRPRDIGVFTLLGSMEATGNFLLALASTLGMVSVNVVLASLYPVMTVALAAIFLRERMHRVQVIGVALALAGVVVLNLPH